MSNQGTLDQIREGVLARMEKQERMMRATIVAAAVLELLMFVAAFLLADWSDRTHVLVIVTAVLTYMILGLGLIALGTHVSRTMAQVLAAITPPTAR